MNPLHLALLIVLAVPMGAHAAPSLADSIREAVEQPEAAPAHAAPAHKAKAPAKQHPVAAPLPKGGAWAALLEGNRRYREGHATHERQDGARRAELAASQSPMAVVLSCSDSRVAPEIVFDQGLGDLFVVRIAGNYAEPATSASIEYAVEHLHAGLIVVMGHERCGALKAAVGAFQEAEEGHAGENPGANIQSLIDALLPSVLMAKRSPGELWDNAIRMNAKRVAGELREGNAVLKEAVKEGHLSVVAARYDLDSGAVEEIP